MNRPFKIVVYLSIVLLIAFSALYVIGKNFEAVFYKTEPTSLLDVLEIGKGFEQSVYKGDQIIAVVKGKLTLRRKDKNVELSEAFFTYLSPRGEKYRLESKKAVFNFESNSGYLSGGVRIALPDKFTILTEQLEIKGREARSKDKVVFTNRELGIYGRSDNLIVYMEEELVILKGAVEVEGRLANGDKFSFITDRVILNEKEKRIEIPSYFKFVSDSSNLSANRATVFWDKDSYTAFIRSNVYASVTYIQNWSNTEFDLWGGKLYVTYSATGGGGIDKVLLEGQGKAPAVVNLKDGYLESTVIRGKVIELYRVGSGFSLQIAVKGTVERFVGDEGYRRELLLLCSDKMRIETDSNFDPKVVFVENGFDFHVPSYQISGDTGIFNFKEKAIKILSEKYTYVLAPLLEIRAKNVFHKRRVVEFFDNVHLRILSSREEGKYLFIRSKKSKYDLEQRVFYFNVGVEAWDERFILRSDSLIYYLKEEKITAGKPVKVKIEHEEDVIHLSSSTMEIDQRSKVVKFFGDVEMRSSDGLVKTDMLIAKYYESIEEIEFIEGKGNVEWKAEQQGIEGYGDYFLLKMEEKVVVIEGNPAKFYKGKNTSVSGPRIIYNFDRDNINVLKDV